MHCDFLGSDGLQETHMDALKPFNSKYVTLTMRGGFFTKFATLDHGAPPPPPHVRTSAGATPRTIEGVKNSVTFLFRSRYNRSSRYLLTLVHGILDSNLQIEIKLRIPAFGNVLFSLLYKYMVC